MDPATEWDAVTGGQQTLDLTTLASQASMKGSTKRFAQNSGEEPLVQRTELQKRTIVWHMLVIAGLWATAAQATTLPPPPDNAALLYYQALIRCPDLDQFPSDVVRRAFRGIGSAEDARKYVDKYRAAIEAVEVAAQMRRCSWGIPMLRATGFSSEVRGPAETIRFLFIADARLLAEGGDYAAAFQKLGRLRQFAAHAANNHTLGTLAIYLEGNAVDSMCHIMGVMPPDAKLLAGLRDELAFDPLGPEWQPAALRAGFEQFKIKLRTDDSVLSDAKSSILFNSSEAEKKVVSNLDDDELVNRICEAYARFLDSVFGVLAEDLTFEQTIEKLDAVVDSSEQLDDPTRRWGWWVRARAVPKGYDTLVCQEASLNALRTGVGVYLARAKTGRLPEVLPGGLAKDPFSGEDFKYEITPEGFVLRCRVKSVGVRKALQFKFQVRK